MATLQSISKNVDNFDDVIIQEPIKTVETKSTDTDLYNGKIQTKDLPQGIEASPAKRPIEKSSNKELSSKTKKKLGLFKKRSLELRQQNSNDHGNTTAEAAAAAATTTTENKQSTELGDYNFQRRVSHFVNMAFENNELESSNLAFADVVRKVLSDPIKEDIHPFGRGHLYASAFDGAKPKTHHEEGKYFMWILASLFIIGIAGSIILMSMTYKPDVVNFDHAHSATISGQNTTS